MPKITSKGQITIPQVIRNKFGFIPGMDVEIIIEGNKALIVKSRDEKEMLCSFPKLFTVNFRSRLRMKKS